MKLHGDAEYLAVVDALQANDAQYKAMFVSTEDPASIHFLTTDDVKQRWPHVYYTDTVRTAVKRARDGYGQTYASSE
jgi:hypothetical protein